MGTLLASSIIDKAEITLNDADNVRWTADELLGWLNSAQREIALLKPNVYTATASFVLAAGIKQTIPNTYHALLEVTRNMGTDGTTPGRAIRPVRRSDLDNCYPEWPLAANANAVVKGFIFDPKDPQTFWVYPPQPASGFGYVEAIMAGPPPTVAIGVAISLDDVYETPILDYILYRAFSKDTSSTGNLARATGFYRSFLQSLGLSSQADAANVPDSVQNTPIVGA